MASDYCYSKEMQYALDRHKAGTCRVVPILLRPTHWEEAPFGSLQLLPTNAKPITSWINRDEAFQDVVAEINRTVNDLLISIKAKEEQSHPYDDHLKLAGQIADQFTYSVAFTEAHATWTVNTQRRYIE